MKRITLFLVGVFLLVVWVAADLKNGIGKSGTAANGSPQCEANADRVAGIERSIERIVQSLSGQSQPVDVPTSKSVKTLTAKSPDIAKRELTERRLEASERSLTQIADFLAGKTKAGVTQSLTVQQKPGSNCQIVRECVYITCCRWGAPPSDPGTVKCMEQCCGTYEYRWVCK